MATQRPRNCWKPPASWLPCRSKVEGLQGVPPSMDGERRVASALPAFQTQGTKSHSQTQTLSPGPLPGWTVCPSALDTVGHRGALQRPGEEDDTSCKYSVSTHESCTCREHSGACLRVSKEVCMEGSTHSTRGQKPTVAQTVHHARKSALLLPREMYMKTRSRAEPTTGVSAVRGEPLRCADLIPVVLRRQQVSLSHGPFRLPVGSPGLVGLVTGCRTDSRM